jgi:hypothetical protein
LFNITEYVENNKENIKMFRVDNYKVTFRYYDWAGEKPDKFTTPKTCECNIYEDDKLTAFGHSHCNPKDLFNYATARKVALAKAVKEFDRETRTKFWNNYFNSGMRRE